MHLIYSTRSSQPAFRRSLSRINLQVAYLSKRMETNQYTEIRLSDDEEEGNLKGFLNNNI